jgi:predicted nucleic acid-binding protein
MRGRAFVDTNVWVYTVDAADPERRRRALEVVGPDAPQDLVVSSQVLAEFYSVVTRKLASPLEPGAAAALASQIAQLPVIPVDSQLVLSAVAASREWTISIWDALIIRAAEVAGCESVLSEDLADGRVYGTVSVVNPFRPTP